MDYVWVTKIHPAIITETPWNYGLTLCDNGNLSWGDITEFVAFALMYINYQISWLQLTICTCLIR